MSVAGYLRCPFCGGEGLVCKVLRDGCQDGEPDAWAFYVRCRACASQGGRSKSPESARKLWNMRTSHEVVKTVESCRYCERGYSREEVGASWQHRLPETDPAYLNGHRTVLCRAVVAR